MKAIRKALAVIVMALNCRTLLAFQGLRFVHRKFALNTFSNRKFCQTSEGNGSEDALLKMPKVATARASHVLLSDESLADSIMQRIKDGESIADLAKEFSNCPSKKDGGDLGWFKKGQMVPEFESACFDNEAGSLVKVKTKFGWHVIGVLQQSFEPMKIDVNQFTELMEKIKGDPSLAEKYQLVDVREKNELDEMKVSDPKFIHIPLSKYDDWSTVIMKGGSDSNLDSKKETIVMCKKGMRSRQMAEFLTYQAGFKKVWNVEGGIMALSEASPNFISTK
mmetsp:Transcript_17091/g.25281  ORF Transcript_17091/g.25281 Transcript_17091/m.25281 type:complete len:279 (-) Transcript_17091:30-866(-)